MTQEASVDTLSPTQLLADRLRSDLARGEYHPRERLVESELVSRYGFARATVRGALVQLATEGLVERSPHRGASVRSLSIDEGIELAEVRRELEALCARDAAMKATTQEREQMRAALEAMRFASDSADVHSYRQASIAFHESVIALSRHDGARRQLAAIRNHNLQRHFPIAFQNGEFSDSSHDHFEIGEAIITGDASAASDAMRRHLDRIVAMLRSHGVTQAQSQLSP
jgi:DNA-binding GntR family transcriptional regulator